MTEAPIACRCGWTGEGDHPCHYRGYQCRQPSTRRLYHDGQPFSLAGAQMKVTAQETYACDDCWTEFSALLKANRR